ncbi:MAG: FdhF/YdeP family oxidoreductase [Myxococcales bacterium]|nr:FdhF/YdeP family oxidoreductase [Myxococcales bacterium]
MSDAEDFPPVNPAQDGEPIIRPQPAAAAGWSAVRSSLSYTWSQAGVGRGRALLRLNQTDGFDCPGCAWPDPQRRAVTEFCENGARAMADEATQRRVGPSFFATYSLDELLQRSDQWLNAQGRLTHPMYRAPGTNHYQPISWDKAFETIATTLNGLESPHQAVFYTSGRTSNEAAFLYQAFVRMFGTNNLPDCSNLCHESSGYGLSESIGIGKGTVSLEDFSKASVIVVIGQNPGTNHPRMLSALQEAKLGGAKIISINPLEEVGLTRFKHPQRLIDMVGRGTALADLHLPVRVGGDYALLCAIQKSLLEREAKAPATVLSEDFIEHRTQGFEEFKAFLATLDMDRLLADAGVSASDIEMASELLARSSGTIVCWAMGITQHHNGVANVQAIVNLLLMGGHFGRPGAGACPVRGHSNVQGDRTVGIWEKLPPWGDVLGRKLQFSPPQETGFDVVGAIEAMQAGRTGVLVAMGGNFLSASPDTERVAAGLRQQRLTVYVSTKLNRSHLVPGAAGLILPCLGRSDQDVQPGGKQFVTVENSMGIVSRSQGSLPPPSDQLLSEPRIVARMAEATLKDSTVDWTDLADDYDRIRDLISSVVPGFEDYNQQVRGSHGFSLPNPVHAGQFPLPGGRARFHVHELPDLQLARGRFWLTTLRSHDQFNTTIYTANDRYRGVYGHRWVVLMSEEDMVSLDLEPLAKVEIVSHYHGVQRRLSGFSAVPYGIPRGNVACYFPEANPLIPWDSFAVGSRTPTSKRVEVSIRGTSIGS